METSIQTGHRRVRQVRRALRSSGPVVGIDPRARDWLPDELTAQPLILLVREPPFALHAIELLDLVGDAESDGATQLVTGLLLVSPAPLGHTRVLGDQVD